MRRICLNKNDSSIKKFFTKNKKWKNYLYPGFEMSQAKNNNQVWMEIRFLNAFKQEQKSSIELYCSFWNGK